MPYALFYQDAKVSKAYPAEADVWKLAKRSGFVVDVIPDADTPLPRQMLDSGYEIRSCELEPLEDPALNKAEAEREARMEPNLSV